MFDLAHITDLHLVEPGHRRRRGADWSRLQYLSAGRPIDAAARSSKAAAAIRAAARNARQLVITGDLTEDGVLAQYELLAELLADCAIDPRQITLVPGNHDGYAAPDAFARALQGPLRAYAATSVMGRPIALGEEALLLPVSTAIAQSCLRSAGRIHDDDVERIERLAADARASGRLALIAQHHPPQGYGAPAWNWIDGLLNAAQGIRLLSAHAHLSVLHGHTHKLASVRFGERPAQAHSGAAAVASGANVRYYQVTREQLVPVAAEAAGAPDLPAGVVALA